MSTNNLSTSGPHHKELFNSQGTCDKCLICHKELDHKPSRDHTDHYCSRDCAVKAMRILNEINE